jgi:hypothetical protein
MGPMAIPRNVSEEQIPQLFCDRSLKCLIFGGAVEWLQMALLGSVGGGEFLDCPSHCYFLQKNSAL